MTRQRIGPVTPPTDRISFETLLWPKVPQSFHDYAPPLITINLPLTNFFFVRPQPTQKSFAFAGIRLKLQIDLQGLINCFLEFLLIRNYLYPSQSYKPNNLRGDGVINQMKLYSIINATYVLRRRSPRLTVDVPREL